MSGEARPARSKNQRTKRYDPNIAKFFEFEIRDLQKIFETEEKVDFTSLLSDPEIDALNRTGNLRYIKKKAY